MIDSVMAMIWMKEVSTLNFGRKTFPCVKYRLLDCMKNCHTNTVQDNTRHYKRWQFHWYFDTTFEVITVT